MKKIICILLVLAMMLGLSGCEMNVGPLSLSISPEEGLENLIKTFKGETIVQDLGTDTIKIGVYEPETGKYSKDAVDEIEGIKLANKLYPVVLGKSVELVYEDNHSEPEYGKEAAQALVDAGCKMVIGSHSNIMTMASADVFEENKVVCICPNCTNPLITTTTNYFFRVTLVEAFQGNSAAKYVIEHLPSVMHEGHEEDPVKCVVLKKSNDEKATAIIERFQAKMEDTYGDDGYAKVIEYNDNIDPHIYLDRLVEAGAEAVFFPSSASDGENVIYNAYQFGYQFQWIGDSDWGSLQAVTDEIHRGTQNHLEGVAYVAAFDNDTSTTEMTDIFLEAAQSYYNISEPSESMALGFDAYILALEAITNAGGVNNSQVLRDETNKLREVDCATGSITFRAGIGDPVKDVVIEKIVNKKITADYTAVPVWG